MSVNVKQSKPNCRPQESTEVLVPKAQTHKQNKYLQWEWIRTHISKASKLQEGAESTREEQITEPWINQERE
jgi:hypothetical protein